MLPSSANPEYTLPAYFAKHHGSPHKWDEIAYLEYLFPEGVQITSHQYQIALNHWIGAIKWLKDNSEHAGQATKLLEQHPDENSRRRLRNWYSRKTRNGKVYKSTKKGASVKVNRSAAAVHVEIQGATFHDVNNVNYGQNYIGDNSNDQHGANGVHCRPTSSPVSSPDPLSASSCRIQGATFHDVNHVNYGQNYIGNNSSDRHSANSVHSRSTSTPGCSVSSPDPLSASSCQIQGATFHDVNHVNYGQNFINNSSDDQQSSDDVHSQSALSPSHEESEPDEASQTPTSPCSSNHAVSPPAAYYEASEASSSGGNPTSVVFSETERVLAEIIRDSNLPQNHIARSGIIVLYDSKVRKLFKPSELQELAQREPPLPELDEVFLDALKGYAFDTTASQFRHTARTHPYRPAGEPHDDSKHAQAEWVDMVVLWMLKLYSGYGDLRAHKLLEGWFDTCIWSVIFDLSTFAYKWMMPRRKEVQSWSLKTIAAHTDNAIDKFNKRSLYDGIIYDETHFDHLEFGIFEVAKDFNSLDETKLVNDRCKLYRGMHGMGRLISQAVDHDPETMKSVQVIGVQNMEFSFQIQVGTPISPEEIIISQGEVQTIPATFDKLQSIFIALKSVGLAMAIMDRSEKAVEKLLHRQTPQDPNLFIEKLWKSGL